jgi:hypothetical protein
MWSVFHLITFQPMMFDLCKKVWFLLVATSCYYFLPVVVFAQTVEATTSSDANSSTSSTPSQQVVQEPSQTTPWSSSDAPYPWCVQQLYRISGYYSPKPNQQITTRDTYEQEIKLNGRGINGASGLPVFNGMIAAPKSYAFGTVIVLPWLGVWQVQDRWWAIVNSDWYDRIDVWLGEWDDGIHRAKSVGLRWVLGRYCPWSVTKDIWFDYNKIPQYSDFASVAFWAIDQNIGRRGSLVTKLQWYLKQLWYQDNKLVAWVYDAATHHLVCRFQIDQLWLTGNEEYCGNLGPQTRTTIKKQLVKQWLISDAAIYALSNTSTISSLFTQPNVRPVRNQPKSNPTSISGVIASWSVSWSVILDFGVTRATFTIAPELGQESNDIIVLQKILAQEWLFDRKVTWYFGPITKDALAKFQVRYKLITSLKHPAAWHIGPATRTLLLRKQKSLK